MIQPIDFSRNGCGSSNPLPTKSSDGALEHVSVSAIKDYLQCSLRYYYKRIEKIPEPASTNLLLGRCVHAGIEKFHRGRWRGESHDIKTVVDEYRLVFDEEESKSPLDFKEGQREILVEKGESLIRAYMDSDHAKMPDIPLGVEVMLKEDFPQLPSPLLGYVDLVRQGNIPVDYKTIGGTPNIELESFQHDLQLTGYQLMIEQATGEEVKGRELVFLVKAKTPRVIVHRLPPADEIAKARFWGMATAMLEGVYYERWVPQQGMHCAWCPYRQQCSQWTGGVS